MTLLEAMVLRNKVEFLFKNDYVQKLMSLWMHHLFRGRKRIGCTKSFPHNMTNFWEPNKKVLLHMYVWKKSCFLKYSPSNSSHLKYALDPSPHCVPSYLLSMS
jgi:hypothetical protein